MTRDEEQRRRRNAKRLLWLLVAAAVILAGLITYTSLTAPDPASRSSKGAAPSIAPTSYEQGSLRSRMDNDHK